jgi:hypothetical protein
MYVSEILSEITGPGSGPFSVVQQGAGRNRKFNIIGPNGTVVGDAKSPGSARTTANRLNVQYRERVFVLPPEGQPLSPELRRWLDNGAQGDPPRSARPSTSTPDASRTPSANNAAPKGFKSLTVNADGTLSGELDDGTKFQNSSFDEVAEKNPKVKADFVKAKDGFLKRITKATAKTAWYGGISAVLGALQILIIEEEAQDEIAKIYAEMRSLRLSGENRQKYYDAAMKRINKRKWVAQAMVVVASIGEAIVAAKTAKRVAQLVQGFAMIARFGGPMGFFAGLAVIALTEGLIYLMGWAISKYGEDFANWLVDSTIDAAVNAVKGGGELAVDAVTGIMDTRGPQIDNDGARGAMQRDEADPNSGNPSDDAKRAVDWLD